MKEVFVLDACSLIAFLADEAGASLVEDILRKARRNECLIYMNIINVLEIYYGIYRCDGKAKADEEYGKIMDLPVIFLDKFDEETVKEAGRFKATYKISLADAIVLACGKLNNAKVVTSDHHEFDILESVGELSFFWIR